jgi:hypothetical protein
MSYLMTDPKELRLRSLRALMGVFAKTNYILSGVATKVELVDNPHMDFPAWTEGKADIKFNDPHIGDNFTADDVLRLTGLDYHELAHVMLTPDLSGLHDELGKWLRQDSRRWDAWNMLEDQRIESMMVALYPNFRHYYTAAFIEYIMKAQQDHSTTFLLSHGRRYLGSEIRDAIRKLFVDQNLARQFATLIDRYRELDLEDTAGRRKARVIVEHFLQLLDKLPKPPKYDHSHECAAGRPTSGNKEKAKEAIKKVQAGEDDRDNMGDEEDTSDGFEGEGEDDDQESNGKGSGKGEDGDDWEDDDEGDGEGEGSDSEDERESKSQGGGAGTEGTKDDNPSVEKAAEKLLNAAKNDPQVQKEIGTTQNAMKGGGGEEAIKEKVKFKSEERPETSQAARAVGRQLQRIVEAQDPGWSTHQSSGRLNVSRAIQGRGIDEIWDLWEEGNSDAASVEGVLLVDTSGSMNGTGDDLINAVWSIKRAFDSVGAPLTVYSYDTDTQVIYEANEKASPNRFPAIKTGGGTNPIIAVREGARRLRDSKRKKRVFITMTDGDWSSVAYQGMTSDQVIAEMNGMGVVTALAFFDTYFLRTNYRTPHEHIVSHGCDIVRVIDSLDDMTALALDLVKAALRRR